MPEARPADPLSILSLAAGIASLVLAMFSVVPMVGWCLMPVGGLAALTALVTGVASIVRTTMKPELDGRQQGIAGALMGLLWCGVALMMFTYLARH